MAKEIKQRIVLEGEKEYNQAINEAKRNLKTLRSELKAETAELGANATAQQKNEARAKSLKEQIKEQEKIVQTLREALKEAQKEYGDNADVVAAWEQKLNEARATLGNMKNDLERTGDGFKTLQSGAAQTVVATKAVADSLEKVGESAGKIADAIQGVFTTVLDQITAAAGKVWELIATTAAKANNWTDLASYYGSSADEIQMWNRSIEAAGGSFEDFIAIVNQLAISADNKSITETLGISKEKYQDDIQYTLAVLDALEKKKKELSQNDFDALLGDLFGRKSRQYMWFLSNSYGHEDQNGNWINGWRDNPERWSGQGTYGVSEEGLSNLNDIYVKMQEINQQWDAIKSKVAEGLGTAALNITTSVSGILEGLAEYMDIAADDPEKDQKRQAALEKIRTNMESFFRAVGQIIRDSIDILNQVGKDLQNSDDPATKLIGDIMVALSDALEWIANHYEEVVIALQAIFGAWLVARIAALAGKLSSFVANIETIKRLKNFTVPNTGNGTGTGTGTGTGGAQTVTTQTVTTQNVTNGTMSSVTVPNETVNTSNVGTMYVQNMVGGNGMTPGGSGNSGSLPGGSETTGLNGYAPMMLPNGGGSDMSLPGGETMNLPNVDTVNLEGGGQQLNLPSGEEPIPGEGWVGEPIPAEPVPSTQPSSGNNDGGGIAEALWEYLGVPVAALGGSVGYGILVGKIAKSFNQQSNLTADPGRYSAAEDKDVLEMVVNGLINGQSGGTQMLGIIGANLRRGRNINSLFDYFNYEDPERGAANWLEDMAGRTDEESFQTRAGLGYMLLHSGFDNTDLNDLLDNMDRYEAVQNALDAYQQVRSSGATLDAAWALGELEKFLSASGAYDASGRWYIPGGSGGLQGLLAGMENGFQSGWSSVLGNWDRYTGSGAPDENGISRGDLEGMKDIPAGVETAAEKGVAKGIRGLKVEIDGQTAGRILAPYVSQEIARTIYEQ